jgi:hypothetical protein
VTVQGHCDERGSTEYNLALGERRAAAVKRYLVDLGVSSSKLRTVSYGEDRPAVPGHDESAWRYNRRADFVAEEPTSSTTLASAARIRLRSPDGLAAACAVGGGARGWPVSRRVRLRASPTGHSGRRAFDPTSGPVITSVGWGFPR